MWVLALDICYDPDAAEDRVFANSTVTQCFRILQYFTFVINTLELVFEEFINNTISTVIGMGL